MPFSPGAKIGVYEIVDALGAGGMGEVYRARDTQLRREVAIKILPDAFAADADRTARFRREAELLAALNHPNIAAVYGVEASGPVHAIVMELVDGETLAETIARGPLPIDEALAVARQIVEALEAAHDRGIVHRDLKPANIKIAPDGRVKVLDFGLAKAMDAGASAVGDRPMTMSPTLSVHATYAGVILGTAAYMSPEQARGKPLDRRTDIWAFGCILFEMLTGRQTFDAGETVSDAVAAILRADVDWNALPASTPPHIRRVMQRCLQKDAQKRLPHIGLVRLEIDDPPIEIAPPSTEFQVAGARTRWSPARVLGVAAAAVAIAAGSAMIAWRVKPAPSGTVTRFTIAVPEGQQFTNPGRRVLGISPDGTRIVYVANQKLYLRSMSDDQPHAIRGSDAAGPPINPAFSPDGEHIVFFAGNERTLKRIAVGGGTPLTVAPSGNPYGLSWHGDYIYSGQGVAGIMRVRATGGSPETIVKVAPGEIAHGPQLLPDGDTLLFTLAAATGGTDRWDKARIVAQSITKGVRKTLIDGGSEGRYLPSGHLVYLFGTTVLAVPFDVSRLEVSGAATPVLEGVRRTVPTPTAHFDVSANGTIVYVPGGAFAPGQQDLALFERQGTANTLKLPPSTIDVPRFSPDGRRVAYATDDGRDASIWIYDLSSTASPRRLTIGGRSRVPLWSADGQQMIFQSDRDGMPSLYRQRADGSGTAERLTTAEPGITHQPESVSPDGKYLLFARTSTEGMRSWLYSFADGKAAPFSDVQSNAAPTAAFSPDGRWVVYTSNVNAAEGFRIYLQPFPATGAKYEIGAGIHAMWSRDGKEILFSAGLSNQMAAVPIVTQPSVTIGKPVLFPRPSIDLGPLTSRPFDVGPDGKIIGIVNVTTGGDREGGLVQAAEMRVIVNWLEELKQRVPVK